MTESYQIHSTKGVNTLINFQGTLDQDMIDGIIFNAESILKNSEPNIRTRKKVFSILVEIVQNIYQYSSDVLKTDGSQTKVEFILRKDLDGYKIISGNTISQDSIPSFREKLERVNQMDKKSLRRAYLSTLANGEFSSSGGAGIGLMHIARKSGRKINYNFSRHTQNLSFFSLEVNVSA